MEGALLLERVRSYERAPYGGVEVAGLPAPVRRYFDRALAEGQRRIAAARVAQEGSFLVRPPAFWRPFRATQRFTARPPGFEWTARIHLFPGAGIAVRDGFHEGAGFMRATLFGFELAAAAGTPEIAAASLQRYLAEAVLTPTALLPHEGVAWEPIDDSSARARLTAGTTTVSLDFRFGADGLVESVYTPARMRDVQGRSQATPWRGSWGEYARQDGMWTPRSGAVEWVLEAGPQCYWRGRITDVVYEFD